ncbi:hypothetical protein ES703_125116 [subsurface metagenome]
MVSEIVAQVFEEVHVLEGYSYAVVLDLRMHHGIAVIMQEYNILAQARHLVDELLGALLNGALFSNMHVPDETEIVSAFGHGHAPKQLAV